MSRCAPERASELAALTGLIPMRPNELAVMPRSIQPGGVDLSCFRSGCLRREVRELMRVDVADSVHILEGRPPSRGVVGCSLLTKRRVLYDRVSDVLPRAA